jgi:hypothetical protein
MNWHGWDFLTCEYVTEVNKLKAIDDIHGRYPNKPGPVLEDTY